MQSGGNPSFPSAALSAATATIGANGVAQVTATANNVGGAPYHVTASIPQGNNQGPSATFQLTNMVVMTLKPTPIIVVYGSAATFTGSLIPYFGIGTPVTVTVDGITGQGQIDGSDHFSVTLNTAGLGVSGSPYSVNYSYAGDATHTAADATSTLTVNPAPLKVTAAAQSMTYGGTVPALTYTYTGLVNGDKAASFTGGLATTATSSSAAGNFAIAEGKLAATGNYTIGTFNPGTLTINRATPVISVSAPGGKYDGSPFPASVTAFPGSADYAATQAAPMTFTIAPAKASVALSSSTGSAVFGQAVTFTATVTGPGAPAGSVTFSAGGTVLGTVTLNASGRATLTTSALAIGSHAVVASYGGSAALGAATSGSSPVSIAQAGSQVVLVPHATYKKKKVVELTLAAEVSPVAPGGGMPTGTVTFEMMQKHKKTLKAIVIGTASLSGGTATLSVKPSQVLKKPVTILYAGDADFQSSSTSQTLPAKPAQVVALARPAVRLWRGRKP
jgi:hypothetical protein